MFPTPYFAAEYFAPRYFPRNEQAITVTFPLCATLSISSFSGILQIDSFPGTFTLTGTIQGTLELQQC